MFRLKVLRTCLRILSQRLLPQSGPLSDIRGRDLQFRHRCRKFFPAVRPFLICQQDHLRKTCEDLFYRKESLIRFSILKQKMEIPDAEYRPADLGLPDQLIQNLSWIVSIELSHVCFQAESSKSSARMTDQKTSPGTRMAKEIQDPSSAVRCS